MFLVLIAACTLSPPPAEPALAPGPAREPAPHDPCSTRPPPPIKTALPVLSELIKMGAADGLTADALIADGCVVEAGGHYADAVDYHAEALRRDPSAIDAHYLIARDLARQRLTGDVCAHDAYASAVLAHLVTASADDNLRALIPTEPAFDPLHGAVRYATAIGADPLAAGLVLYGPPQGVFGNTEIVTLDAEGVARVRQLDTMSADQPAWHETDIAHGWRVDAGALILDVDHGEQRLAVDAKVGVLTDDAGNVRYTDAPSECEA